MISGIAVSSLGHGHPAVLRAIHEQVDKHLHVMVYGEFVIEPQVRLATLLTSHLPSSLGVVYLTNSGTEANEGALKVARKYTGRTRMVAFQDSYHGDTMGALSVTGRSVYRQPFEPLIADVTFLPYDDISALSSIDASVACVIAEPIQGEGGVRVPSNAWVHELRRACTRAGALLIFDEIQTGFGRTGSLFAFQQLGVAPDVLTMAKSMGGGMPLGGFAASREIMAVLRRDPALNHVTTFGGHPVSCAAAAASLRVLIDEDLASRAKWIEQTIKQRLRHARIVEIRGRGAMLGMLLDDDELTARFVAESLSAGVLLGWTLHSNRLVRIAPPLTIPEPILHSAVDRMIDALNAAATPNAAQQPT